MFSKKASALLAILLSLCLQPVSSNEEDVLTTDLLGNQYVFDQKAALDSLNGAIQGLKSDIEKAKTKGSEYSFVESSMDLYGILLGFAYCGKPDARLKELLSSLKHQFAAVPVPSFLSLGVEREQFWKSFVVSQKGTGTRLTPDSLQSNFYLYLLVQQVEQQITKRTGERFDD